MLPDPSLTARVDASRRRRRVTSSQTRRMESDILDSLEQLGYDGALLEEKALLRAAEGGLSSQEYVYMCRWLASRLKPLCDLEESVSSGPEDMVGLQVEMSGLLKELHCPYEELVSGILKGASRNTKDHLKILCMLQLPFNMKR